MFYLLFRFGLKRNEITDELASRELSVICQHECRPLEENDSGKIDRTPQLIKEAPVQFYYWILIIGRG